jgi:hypothetical protein
LLVKYSVDDKFDYVKESELFSSIEECEEANRLSAIENMKKEIKGQRESINRYESFLVASRGRVEYLTTRIKALEDNTED